MRRLRRDTTNFSFSTGTQTVSTIGGLASAANSADNSFTLSLSAALSGSPTLGYTQSGTDAKIIKDVAGNKLAAVTGKSISGITNAPSAPSAIDLKTPASSPGKDTTPTFTVTVGETGGTVTLYSDSACSSANAVSSATNVTDAVTPFTVDVTTNAYSGDGAKTVYAKHTKSGLSSSCSTAAGTYTLDTTAPTVSLAYRATETGSDGLTNAGLTDTIYAVVTFSEQVEKVEATDTIPLARVFSLRRVLLRPSCSTTLSRRGVICPVGSVSRIVLARCIPVSSQVQVSPAPTSSRCMSKPIPTPRRMPVRRKPIAPTLLG